MSVCMYGDMYACTPSNRQGRRRTNPRCNITYKKLIQKKVQKLRIVCNRRAPESTETLFVCRDKGNGQTQRKCSYLPACIEVLCMCVCMYAQFVFR